MIGKKILIGGAAVLIPLFLFGGWYIKSLLEENAELNNTLDQFEQTNERLNSQIQEQREELLRREQIISDRQDRVDELENRLRQRTTELDKIVRESDDMCLGRDIPDDILEWLSGKDRTGDSD